MRALVKSLIAIVLVLVALFAVMGPGRVVAGAEYPFGVGPWSSTGRYCHDIYEMAKLADQLHHSHRTKASAGQKASWFEYEKTLTKTGPVVPRADFTAWYRTTGNWLKTMERETSNINTWWNKNCTDPMMEAPASINHVWSGLGSHTAFARFPKNIIQLKNFFKVIT